MKYEIAMAWAKDLRDNQDKQGRSALLTNDGKYCCLGRLCVVVGATFDEHRACYGASSILPKEVMNIAGMRTAEGMLPFEAFWVWLCEANDNGVTFAEIADIIEKHWDEL